jgi:hypothetical protein
MQAKVDGTCSHNAVLRCRQFCGPQSTRKKAAVMSRYAAAATKIESGKSKVQYSVAIIVLFCDFRCLEVAKCEGNIRGHGHHCCCTDSF